MTDNFLPEHAPVEDGRGCLMCELRGKKVRATPEEYVRQRVLHWLMHEKDWSRDHLRLEQSYSWVGDAGRHRIRSDIELLDDDGQVLVVVECKNADVPLSQRVDQQAIEYAIKSGADWIWTTNGDRHGFLRRAEAQWEEVSELEPLSVIADPPVKTLHFPENVDDAAEVERYWHSLDDQQFLDQEVDDDDRRFVLAVHRVLFDVGKKLPYSHGGMHILEDRGSAWHQFKNAGGDGYYARYADYVAATRGTVVSVSVAVNCSWSYETGEYLGLRLCVGVTKSSRVHHALQLDTAKCWWNEDTKSWSVDHDGTMSGIKSETVLEAVQEAGAGGWIYEDDDGKEWVYLGELPNAASTTWQNSRELLANLIHYGIIRSNLRDAVAERKRNSRSRRR